MKPRRRSGRRTIRVLLVGGFVGLGPLAASVTAPTITPTPTPTPTESPSEVPPGNYTYDELIALGVEIPPLGEDLPPCEEDPGWDPPDTPEEAEQAEEAAAEAPECLADITEYTFTVGAPPPHPDYHHNGVQTTGNWRGGDSFIESGDPAVDHVPLGNNDEFIVGRVLGKNASVEWVEAGWAEVSWKSATPPYVYTFTEQSGNWAYPSGYPIDPGDLVNVRVHDCDGDGTCGSIYWSGQWNRIAKATNVRCYDAAGDNNCNIENYLEAYSAQENTPHPDIGSKLHTAADVKKNDGTWKDWDTSVFSFQTDVDPYDLCMDSRYTSFHAGRSITC